VVSRLRVLLPAFLLLVAAGLSAAARWSEVSLRGSVGLAETVYRGTEFSGPPALQRVTRALDLSVLDEHPQLPRRYFSSRFAGTWLVAEPGPVEIYAGGDDSVRIFVDDELIIERNQELGFATIAAGTKLSAGPHRILIEYVQRGGDAALRVLWAPEGKAPRPIPPESLFVGPPDAILVARARRAARLAELARLVWIAFGAAGLSVLVPLVGRTVRRWLSSGVPQDLVRRALHSVAQWQALYARPAFWLASGAAILWSAGVRMPALNPQTLWSDDVAVACLAKLDSLWTALTVPAPLAPGFVALLWVARRMIGDPEVSLQALPLMFGLVGPLVTGIVVSRLTASRMLGFIAVVLALGTANLAQYSVFVKPYTLDYTLTALFLLLAALLLVEGREVRLAAAAAGLVAVMFSVPSVFVSVALVHLVSVVPGLNVRTSPPSRRLRWGTVAAFNLLLAVVYIVVFRHRSDPALRAWWSDGFAPAASLVDLVRFLRTTGWTAIQEALPAPLAALAPLAGIGLAALVISPRWRWFGLFLALVFAGAIAASMLQIYPIGIGTRARVSIYTYPLTTVLVAVGFDALIRWLPIRAPARAAAAIAVVFCVARVTPPAYPKLDQVQLVRALESSATPDDAIVLNTPGASLAGYYTSWPISAQADQSPYGFAVRIERPRTLTLPRAAEEGGPGLELLDRFLDSEKPERVRFFSTRRGTDAAENAIRQHGFKEVRRSTGDVSARLIEYRRAGSQEEPRNFRSSGQPPPQELPRQP
jgi:hypothetical protein